MKNNKGITIISLIITIVVMIIISGVTVSVSMDRFKINNVKKMQNDIELLNDKTESYYLKYGGLPILKANGNNVNYTYSQLNFNRDANDNANYYIIDLSSIGNITLNYGEEGFRNPNTSDDVYIINEKTHSIYYVKGVEYKDGTIYHSVGISNIQGNINIGPAKPEINVLSKDDDSIEIEIIPGKDNINGVLKTEYNIKSTDIYNSVTQTENIEISESTVVGDLSIDKAHEITVVTTSNNNSTSEKVLKINEWIDKLDIGDYVNYSVYIPNVTVTSESKIITDLATFSGNTDSNYNTESTISQESLGWRVFDIKDGKIRLISEQQSSFNIRLQSYNGYNNAVYLLDEISDALYSSNKGKAQNLKIEDIEEKINKQSFDFTQYEGSDTAVKYGEMSEYTDSFKYPNIYAMEEGYQRANNISNQAIRLGLSEQNTLITGISNASDSLKTTNNYWYHFMSSSDFKSSIYFELLIRENNTNLRYWISSRCINNGLDAARYNIRCIRDREVTIANLFKSTTVNGGGYNYPIRPVVTLSSEIKIGEKVDGVWQINS